MREILFRGFCENFKLSEAVAVNGRTFRGKWVYGYFSRGVDESYDWIQPTVVIENGMKHTLPLCEVIPETVGQFTGLLDKNGKKIFEGDLVLGKRRHMSGDGYLKKGYPSEISVILEVVFKRGNFSTREIGAVKEHEFAYSEYQYREGETSLSPSWKGAMYYNAETKKFDLEGDDKTCKHLEVIGTIFDVKEEEHER